MQDDLTAGARYLVKEGYASPDAIAIMGGSYGGYATLAGLTFTPDEYAAGVSIVGPSNLFTLLDTIPPYWESARVMFHKRMGNPNTEEGRAQLKRQSPFFHAQNIKVPLLVAQGANDPRVKKSESDQIVIAMRDHDLQVEYLNFPDEGHGFANPKNNMAFIAVMEAFLSKHLGGRYQKDIPDDLKEIIEKVTVDIQSLEMPEIYSEKEMQTPLLLPSKAPQDEKLLYEMSFDMQGQTMKFDVEREIKKEGEKLMITDFSSSQAGEMKDSAVVSAEDFHVIKRDFSQGPMSISYTYDANGITGEMDVNGQKQPIAIKPDNAFVMDGPSLDSYLASLELTPDTEFIFHVLDSQGLKIRPFKFSVLGEDRVDLYDCYKCKLESIDGSEKSQTLWFNKSYPGLLVRKTSVIKQMGGAIMDMYLSRK